MGLDLVREVGSLGLLTVLLVGGGRAFLRELRQLRSGIDTIIHVFLLSGNLNEEAKAALLERLAEQRNGGDKR